MTWKPRKGIFYELKSKLFRINLKGKTQRLSLSKGLLSNYISIFTSDKIIFKNLELKGKS